MTASSARTLALIVLGFAVAACEALDAAERATIDAWLACTECNEHELDSVLALAGRKHDPTVTALRDGLLEGPTSVQRQNASRQLETLYDRVAVVGGPMPPMNPRTEFVRHYLDNIVATYRVRSAIALAHIGGADVKPALDSAAANQLRIPSDTLRPADLDAVAFARDSIWQP